MVAKLEELIEFMCQSVLDELRGAMNATLQTDAEKAKQVPPQLRDQLKSIGEIAKILDDIDPHSINKAEFERLKKKRPTELVEDALAIGKLRERRVIIEAKEAEINRKLARWTWIAALAGIAAGLGAVVAALVAVF